jgi:vacuolar-type H+-ATPase subunit F/Vma7
MENTNGTGAINTSNYNTITNDNTKPIQKTAIKVVNDQNKQLPLAKGYFSEDGTVFPDESIILRGLTIIKDNPSIGVTGQDIRKQWIKHYTNEGQCKVTTFSHTLPIFQPKDMTITAILQHYKKKYDINIYYINNNVKNSIGKLVQQLKNKEQIGVITNISDKKWHMTPVVISKNNDHIYIVTLDSIDRKNYSFWRFFSSTEKLIETCGTQHCHLFHAGIPRQQDMYSCINDAIIVLKDALRKPNLINDLLKTSKTVDVTYNDKNNGKTVYQVVIAEFPKYLYKTVQNKKLLDELTTEDLQTSLTAESTDVSSIKVKKTLQTHFNKYNRTLTVMKKTVTYGDSIETKTQQDYWQVNTYLQTKPYRMLVKSFEEIADSNGKINQEIATKLMEKYVNPSF